MMSRQRIEFPPKDKRKWPEGFSVHRDGWARSYRGRTIVISGKTLDKHAVAERFAIKRREIDIGLPGFIPTGKAVTLREALSAYFTHLDRRVIAGKITARQRENLVYEANRFCRFVDGGKLARTIGPQHFSHYYAEHLRGKSPHTVNATVSRVSQFFAWMERNEVIDRIRFGDDWARSKTDEVRDRRLSHSKMFSVDEIGALWKVSPPMWRVWIAFGVVCAFTNSDLAHLTHDIMDRDVIDYRRRKVGKELRLIVLPPAMRELLATYRRPAPADDRHRDFVFLMDTGTPYDQPPRRQASCNEFRELMEAAGVYRKGRNFTGLRTTYFNSTLDAPTTARNLIMGRKPETVSRIDWLHYTEHVDTAPIGELTQKLWDRYFSNAPQGEWVDVLAKRPRGRPRCTRASDESPAD